jgi:hypothetical protein
MNKNKSMQGANRSRNLDTVGTPPGKRSTGPRGALRMTSFNGTYDPYKTVLDVPERICNGTSTGVYVPDMGEGRQRNDGHKHLRSFGTGC